MAAAASLFRYFFPRLVLAVDRCVRAALKSCAPCSIACHQQFGAFYIEAYFERPQRTYVVVSSFIRHTILFVLRKFECDMQYNVQLMGTTNNFAIFATLDGFAIFHCRVLGIIAFSPLLTLV